jgi:uncharacterized cupredoxin-like copper-binding protein
MNKSPFFSRFTLLGLFVGALCIVTHAYAGGDHAGGHHHGETGDIGHAGAAEKAKRTITIQMLDTMRFSPASIRVQGGETVRFVIHNVGKVKHELVLGTEADLREHNAFMQKNPEMEHEDDNMVTVQPGQRSEIIWQFGKTGTVHFACLQPGHYGAGMKGRVTIRAPLSHDGHTH